MNINQWSTYFLIIVTYQLRSYLLFYSKVVCHKVWQVFTKREFISLGHKILKNTLVSLNDNIK